MRTVKHVGLNKGFEGPAADVGIEMAREVCLATHEQAGPATAVELACGLISGAVGVLAGMSSREHAASVLEAAARGLRDLSEAGPDVRH
jgi:hypothetical protein